MDSVAKGAALAVWLIMCGCAAIMMITATALAVNVINQRIVEVQHDR